MALSQAMAEVVVLWEGRAVDLTAVAMDLEEAGISARHTRQAAAQLRHNASEVKAGRRITLLPPLAGN